MFHVFSCTHILSFHSFKLLCNLLRITYYECNVFCRMGHSTPVHLTFICASHNSCGVTQSSSLTLPEKVLNYSKGECFNWSAINPSRLKHPSVKKYSKAIKICSGVLFRPSHDFVDFSSSRTFFVFVVTSLTSGRHDSRMNFGKGIQKPCSHWTVYFAVSFYVSDKQKYLMYNDTS